MYQTSKLVIKNDLESIEPVIAYLKAICTLVGLNEKENHRLSFALEESLQNSILFDFEAESDEEIQIEFKKVASGILITISDRGIPKNPFAKKPKTLQEIADEVTFEKISKSNGDEISAMSDFVIHKLLNRYKYINNGKDGRCIQMLMYASESKINDNDSIVQQVVQKDDKFSLIRSPEGLDITGISRLFYKSYAYSYVNDLVYYPQRLAQALAEKKLISKVAVSQDDKIIGHIALMQPFEQAKITEWGMAISDPLFRGQGVMSQLIKIIMQEAQNSSYKGIFSHSVTNHEFTQKICLANNFSDVALLVGYAGSDLSFKKISSTLTQRESTIISYKVLDTFSNTELFLPNKHEEMIKKLYKGIGINVSQKKNTPPSLASTTNIDDTLIPAINIAEIVIRSIAQDAFSALEYITKKHAINKIDIIYLVLNLEDSATTLLVEGLEQLGYVFGGIFPHYHHEHALILQYINNIKFDYNLINAYTDLAKELKSYIQALDPNQIDTIKE